MQHGTDGELGERLARARSERDELPAGEIDAPHRPAANGRRTVGGGAVWSIDLARGELVALAPSTGQPPAQLAVGPVPHFASPTLWNGEVFVGTDSGVTAIDAR